MQSYDCRYYKVCINQSQVKLDDDGRWTIYLAKEDPGLGNWIGTAGHSDGIVFVRWLLSEEHPERPSSELVKRSALVG